MKATRSTIGGAAAIARKAFAAILLAAAAAAAPAQASDSAKNADWGVLIQKKDIGTAPRYYPYSANGLKMEIFAVEASDGTIRTALNTCQVCYRSGRGFYKWDGKFLVCQNCGNKFRPDQVEVIIGGCNPIPIQAKDKKDLGLAIGVSKEFLAGAAPYFKVWKAAL
jgi:uncharacterized membrane protein